MSTKPQGQVVHQVTGIRIEWPHAVSPRVKVSVAGTVQSTGWTDPQLVPYTYVQPPPDGVYDYDFVATPPSDITAKVITPVRHTAELPAAGVNGIRIHAADNDMEEIWNPQPAPAAQP